MNRGGYGFAARCYGVVGADSGALKFGFACASWLKSMSDDRLTKIFGVLLIVFGVRMLWAGKA